MKPRACWLALLLLLVLPFGACGDSSAPPPSSTSSTVGTDTTSTTLLPPDVVARVGNTLITQEQFAERLAGFEAQYEGQVPDRATDPDGYLEFQRQTLDYLVMVELAKQKAPSLNVSVTDADVQAEVQAMVTDYYGGDEAAFGEDLASLGMTRDQYEQSIMEQLLLQGIFDRLMEQASDPGASEAEQLDAWNGWLAATKTELGVLYRPGMEPATAAIAVSTTVASDVSTTVVSSAQTTATARPVGTTVLVQPDEQAMADTFAAGLVVYLYDPQPASVHESDLGATTFRVLYCVAPDSQSARNVLWVNPADAQGVEGMVTLTKMDHVEWTTKCGELTFRISSFSEDANRDLESRGIAVPHVDADHLVVYVVSAQEANGGVIADPSQRLSNVVTIPYD